MNFVKLSISEQRPKKITVMFNIFKKKSEKEVLQKKYSKLMEEAHKLSHINRKLADVKVYEADEVMKRLEKLSWKVFEKALSANEDLPCLPSAI